MSFIRAELTAAAWRWRESLCGAAVAALGLWWVITGDAVVALTGLPIAGIGAAWALVGWQRARFRSPGDGPGIVRITERRIAYYGPLTGGAIGLDAVAEIALDPSGKPAHWRLAAAGGEALFIPVTAAGADALLDVFAQLPGFRTDAMLRRLADPGNAVAVLWRRPGGPARARIDTLRE